MEQSARTLALGEKTNSNRHPAIPQHPNHLQIIMDIRYQSAIIASLSPHDRCIHARKGGNQGKVIKIAFLSALIPQVRLVLQNLIDLIALPCFLGADVVTGALGADVVFRKPCL